MSNGVVVKRVEPGVEDLSELATNYKQNRQTGGGGRREGSRSFVNRLAPHLRSNGQSQGRKEKCTLTRMPSRRLRWRGDAQVQDVLSVRSANNELREAMRNMTTHAEDTPRNVRAQECTCPSYV